MVDGFIRMVARTQDSTARPMLSIELASRHCGPQAVLPGAR